MAKIQGVHIPSVPKNYWINGNLDFWQRVGGNTTTVNTATTAAPYHADRLKAESQGTTVKNYSVVRSTDVPSLAQSGFNSTYSALFTMITGIASPAASDFVCPYEYHIEGYDYQKIHGKLITIGFWIKGSVPGNYSLSLMNSAFNRTYVTTWTLNAANTWEFKQVRIQLDTTGTWSFDTSFGLRVNIGGYGGSNYTTTNDSTWFNGVHLNLPSHTNWQATSGATLRIAQLSIVEGALGLGPTGFVRAGDTVEDELAMCQRYYEKSYPIDVAPGSAETTNAFAYFTRPATAEANIVVHFRVPKRAVPPMVSYSPDTGTVNTIRQVDGTGAPADRATTAFTGTISGGRLVGTIGSANGFTYAHWTADADY